MRTVAIQIMWWAAIGVGAASWVVTFNMFSRPGKSALLGTGAGYLVVLLETVFALHNSSPFGKVFN